MKLLFINQHWLLVDKALELLYQSTTSQNAINLMNNEQTFKEKKYWFYNGQKQAGIMASIARNEDGLCIAIRDGYGQIQPSLQDVPILIEMLKRLLKNGLN